MIILFLYPLVTRGCHDEERIALLTFKSFLEDPADRLSSWQDGRGGHQDCCNWYGVGCSDDSFHVVSIDLRNRDRENYINRISFSFTMSAPAPPNTSLTGIFSPSLFKITRLEYLDLGYNDIQSSELPHQFSSFAKLIHLDLSNTLLSGSVTTQFANLTSLEYLDISGISFTTTSLNWLRGLVDLKVLRLSYIDLYEATSSQKNFAEPISFLSNLKDLDLSNCRISTKKFPINEFLNLSSLASLRMSYNDLTFHIPVRLSNLTSLSILDFSGCNLQGSVPYIPQRKELAVSGDTLEVNLTSMFERKWPRLEILNIEDSSVNGSIPSTISNAPLLVKLLAKSCSIEGSLPATISNLYRLQSLDLSMNNITGCLPTSISNLKQLEFLSMDFNNLQGPIPESICEISSLKKIELRSNNLTGTFPSCITKLRNLEYLNVDRNSIEGTISLVSLINDLSLSVLNLNSNRLTVVIDQGVRLHPSKFKLNSLELKSCNIKGYIPSFICNCTDISYLDLSNNNFTGPIPPCIFNIKYLSDFDLSRNNLVGSIPYLSSFVWRSIIMNISRNNLYGPLPLPTEGIGLFDLSHNQFTGGISEEIGNRLSSCLFVSLSSNELSGSIPYSICSNLTSSNIAILDLSKNNLSGGIPSTIGYCSSLESLNLGINNLSGNIPHELGQASSLRNLLLNGNAFNGTFPNFIQRFKSLQFLSLGDNNFEGTIPPFIGSLLNLKILSLRSNKFNGSIPVEITNLHELQILDFSMNSLSGSIPRKMDKLKMLISRPNEADEFFGYMIMYTSNFNLEMVIKGVVTQFLRLYNYNSGIDLSCNNLVGEIPREVILLQALATLNLSHNHLHGKIPARIGNMTGLNSLDLSFNKLSGKIPQSLTTIDSLGYLNLSYNNLSGRIPTGPHFDTLSIDGSAYANNSLLCGSPLKNTCEDDDQGSHTTDTNRPNEVEEDAKEKILFYGVIALGFVVGFWGPFFVLLSRKQTWWFGYWRFIDSVAVRIARLCLLKNE